MLSAHHLYKSYGINPILEDVTFSLTPGDRVGLIGPNGSGKTTLLRILAGQESPDRGHIALAPANLRIGYLPQGFELDPLLTISSIIQRLLGDLPAAETELARLASELAQSPENATIQAAYDAALQQLQFLSENGAGRAGSVLAALGLDHVDPELPAGALSGGQKTRLALATVLLDDPQVLLLDEPTNHLDIAMLEWLEGWVSAFRGAALIVSHDRTFLDHTVNGILYLDPEKHSLQSYTGNYSAYLDQYLAEQERLLEAYQDQVYEIRRMRQDIARTKAQAAWVEQTTTSRQPGVRRYAKKVAKKAKSREKKLERYVESDERVEKPRLGWQMKLEFEDNPHLGQHVLSLENLSVGYSGYAPLLEDLNLSIRARQRVVLTGPNGSGKTALLRTITGQVEPLAGQVRLGASARLGWMSQEQELLDPSRSALELVQAAAPMNETEVRSFLHYFLFTGDDPLRPSAELSFGERARLSMALLVAQGCNFLLLDEPINHLDIPSRERFEQALAGFDGAILAVVHDRYFIQRFATDVWLVEGKQIQSF